MENELVTWMKDLLDAYEYREEDAGYAKTEIRMWRNKFLNSLPKEENSEQAARLWSVFMYISSCDFMGNYKEENIQVPEKHIRDIRRGLNEN